MTIRLRNMTRERGSILATNRGLRRMRYEIIALTILAVSCGDSPTRPRVPDPPVQPAPAAPTPQLPRRPPRRRRRPRTTPTSLRLIGPSRVAPGETVRSPHSRRRRRLRNKTSPPPRHGTHNPILRGRQSDSTAPGVALGTRPGEGMVGASLGGRPASMRVSSSRPARSNWQASSRKPTDRRFLAYQSTSLAAPGAGSTRRPT